MLHPQDAPPCEPAPTHRIPIPFAVASTGVSRPSHLVTVNTPMSRYSRSQCFARLATGPPRSRSSSLRSLSRVSRPQESSSPPVAASIPTIDAHPFIREDMRQEGPRTADPNALIDIVAADLPVLGHELAVPESGRGLRHAGRWRCAAPPATCWRMWPPTASARRRHGRAARRRVLNG